MGDNDDFGELYTQGTSNTANEEDFNYSNNNAAAAPENPAGGEEEDIYTFSEGAARNRDGVELEDGEEVEDDDEDVQIVLDQDSVDRTFTRSGTSSTPNRPSSSMTYTRTPGGTPGGATSLNTSTSGSNRSGPAPVTITPGGSYSLQRNINTSSRHSQRQNIFELDIDSLDEKPWRKPTVDITDYFNYGFNEDSWREYCQKQIKIKVYESGEPEGADAPKRSTSSTKRDDNWTGGRSTFRRPRDQDDAVIPLTGDAGDEYSGGSYNSRAYGEYAHEYERDYDRSSHDRDHDRHRDDDRRRDRERDRRRSPSPRRDDKERDKRRDDRDRRDRKDGTEIKKDGKDDAESRRREGRTDEKEREDHKRKSTSTSADEERAKRRR